MRRVPIARATTQTPCARNARTLNAPNIADQSLPDSQEPAPGVGMAATVVVE